LLACVGWFNQIKRRLVMSPIRPYEKKKYHKKSTKDLSKLKPVVDREFKKRNDELFETLVDNLNKNTTKEE